VELRSPKLLKRNRDWGTATFDTDRLQILYFSGGHCAYSGTDVALYSTRASTWRINSYAEMPIEFCHGTGYHAQKWSFNGRPFMSSHRYKLYGYDPVIKKMVVFNRGLTFLFDPFICEWIWPPIKPPFSSSGAWVLKFCTTPKGVIVWANVRKDHKKRGRLWRMNPNTLKWEELKAKGAELGPTPNDDFGGIVYDSKRRRLILFASDRKERSKVSFALQQRENPKQHRSTAAKNQRRSL